MTITQAITALPAAPNPATDTPTVFSEKAAAYVAAQQMLPPELNTWATQANALAKEAVDAGAAAKEAALTATSKAGQAVTSAAGAADSAKNAATSEAAAAASAKTIGTVAAFSDDNPIAKNALDPSKQLKVSLVSLAASQVVTLAVRALNGTVALLSDLTQFVTPKTYYNAGAVNALNLANGGVQRWAPATGAQTLTITGWPPAGTEGCLRIEGVNLGLSTITWPAAINWIKFDGSLTTTFAANGVTLRTAGVDHVILFTVDGGTIIYGKVVR